MKRFIVNGTVIMCITVGAMLSWFTLNELSVLFLFSRIERFSEKGLPNARIENGDTLYCRMKADDFRFPLPPGTHAVAPTIDSGGFDTVNGHLEVQFDQADFFAAEHYELWLKNKVSIGGNVTAQTVPTSLLIKFSYFGDR